MKRNPYKILMPALMIVTSTIIARADYSYSNAVAAFSPAAYWPLDETNQPPPAYIATNSGTLGAQANGYYGNDYYPNGSLYSLSTLFTGPVAGPTSDGSKAAQFNGGANNNDDSEYVIIPDANGVLDKGPVPFSAEAWVMPEGGDPNDVTGTSFASSEFTGLMKKGGGIAFYTENGANGNTFGWTVSLTGIYGMGPPGGWYGGFSPGEFLKTNACWVVDFYNGARGNTPSLEFDVPMAEPTPQWFHLALTYDGTNANFYTNGVLAATTVLGLSQSTNTVIAPNQLGGITSATGAYQFIENSDGQGYVPDTVNPFCVGNNNESFNSINGGWPQTNNFTGFNSQNFNGALADVAVYTNALSSATVLQHYTDATAANPTLYTNDVLSANPPIFLRFNEPAYTEPDPGTYPVANSYGTMSGANGAYQPGVIPAIAGAVAGGLGPKSLAVQINGFDAGIDVGGGILSGSDLDPQNNPGVPSFSLAYWFKANPADCYGRFQGTVGRGDSAWRSSIDNGGHIRWNPGAGPEIASPNNYNDGLWHHVVGVCDGSSGNAYLYVDGQLSTSGTGVGGLAGSAEDLLIGGAPDYTTGDRSGSQQRYFAGQLTEVAFFTNALSASDVQTLYNAAAIGPQITQEPVATEIIGLGAFGTLSVTASGSLPTYQWYQGTTALSDVAGNISGSATATLTITNATLSNAGNYTVVVANSTGSVTSSVATVTVSEAPTVLQQPSPKNIGLYQGNPISYIVGAVGAAPFTYQWYNGTSPINNATSSNLTVIAALGTNTYDCVVQNTFGAATSSVVTVVGQLPPSSLIVNYSVVSPAYNGQGAFSDPGHTNWNLFAASGTPSGAAANSAGASTLVTATLIFGFNNGSMNGVTNGTPSYLVAYEDAVNGGSPGIGNSGAPEGQLTINDLPQGKKYELYLYAANYDDNRGSIFTLGSGNSGVADGGTNGTINSSIVDPGTGGETAAGTNRFAEGDNFVLFHDVAPDTNGAITVTYVPNPAGILTGEAPFDGFQLVEIVPPIMSLKAQGNSNDVVSWAPAIGQLLSSPNAAGPYSPVSGATSPYTNVISGAPQQFFRVNVP